MSFPCINVLCAELEHNLPFFRCSNRDFSNSLELGSKFKDVYSTSVSYSCYPDKSQDALGPNGDIDHVFDLLPDIDNRNFCKCTMVDDLEQVNFGNTALLLIHLNIRSLPAHYTEFEALLSLIPYQTTPAVVCVCETWLTEHNETLYIPAGFNAVFNSRKNKSGGGVSILTPVY